MDERARCEWIATHILPCEAEIRGWLRRHLRTLSPDDIDDVLQEAYARLWSASADFSRVRNGRSYFYTVVRNVVWAQARHARIIPMERIGEIESLSIISSAPGPERITNARQELEHVRRVVAGLPPRCRRVFELHSFAGISQREIARRMGITQKTVENQLVKAFARIIEVLGAEPISVEEVGNVEPDKYDLNQQTD